MPIGLVHGLGYGEGKQLCCSTMSRAQAAFCRMEWRLLAYSQILESWVSTFSDISWNSVFRNTLRSLSKVLVIAIYIGVQSNGLAFKKLSTGKCYFLIDKLIMSEQVLDIGDHNLISGSDTFDTNGNPGAKIGVQPVWTLVFCRFLNCARANRKVSFCSWTS